MLKLNFVDSEAGKNCFIFVDLMKRVTFSSIMLEIEPINGFLACQNQFFNRGFLI